MKEREELLGRRGKMVGVRRRASRGEFRVGGMGESEGGERRRGEQEVELESEELAWSLRART